MIKYGRNKFLVQDHDSVI